MKKIFLLLAVAMLYVPGSRAVDVSATGSCGNGLEWTLGLEDSLSVEPGVPARTVLFKLGDNEEIFDGEYFLMQLLNQNRFACVVLDTTTDSLSFIFNGKRIASGPRWSRVGRGFNVYYFDLSENNGYIVHYSKKVASSDEEYIHYINYKGVVGGPFDNIHYPDKYRDDYLSGLKVMTPEDNYDYLYELAGRWYAHKNGKNKRVDFIEVKRYYGKDYININGKQIDKGHSDIQSFRLTKSGIYAYAYQDEDKGKWCVNINGKVGEPHEDIASINLTENGIYAYVYEDNGKEYANINGTVSEPHKQIEDINLTESGIYAYRYEDNGKWYANINGKVSEPHEQIDWHINLTESGIYAYRYRDNGKWYANINGKVSEPHEQISNINLTESGIYAYRYEDNGKEYVNINGKVSEPHEQIGWDINLTESGIYTYVYRDNGKWYANINGKVELYSQSKLGRFVKIDWLSNRFYDGIDVSTPDEEHSFYSSFEYEYVVIDGKRYCDSPAIQAWFDNKKNAFVWNAVEGRELVVYEFKLD